MREVGQHTGMPLDVPLGQHPLDWFLVALRAILGPAKAEAYLTRTPDTWYVRAGWTTAHQLRTGGRRTRCGRETGGGLGEAGPLDARCRQCLRRGR